MATPLDELVQALSSLYVTGKYSDLAIVCQDQRYPVHKALLCSRSHFFESACNGRFAVQSFPSQDPRKHGLTRKQESSSGEVDLSDEDEEAVEHMVHYFYHLVYLTPVKSPRTSKPPPAGASTKKRFALADVEDPLVATATAVQEQRAADKSQRPQVAIGSIIPLFPAQPGKARSASPKPPSRRASQRNPHRPQSRPRRTPEASSSSQSQLKETQTEQVADDTADLVVHARVYALAEKYGVPGLKKLAKEKFEVLAPHRWDQSDFVEAAVEVYTSTIDDDRGLRNVVLQAFRQRPELANRDDLQEVLQEVAPLAKDLHRIQHGQSIPA